MRQASLDVVHWITFGWLQAKVFLVVFIEVNEVGIIIVPLPHRAISDKMSLLPTLEACSIGVPTRWSLCGCCPSSSGSSPTPTPIWCVSVIDVHWDRLVVHPLWGIGRVES